MATTQRCSKNSAVAFAVTAGIMLGLLALAIIGALAGVISDDDLPMLIAVFTALGGSNLALYAAKKKGGVCAADGSDEG